MKWKLILLLLALGAGEYVLFFKIIKQDNIHAAPILLISFFLWLINYLLRNSVGKMKKGEPLKRFILFMVIPSITTFIMYLLL